MADINYTSLQGIREEAGLQHEQKFRLLTGVADGANKVFYADRLYIVDRDNDDSVNSSDVVVYVDNIAVNVTAVDAVTGAITLEDAPSNGAVVKATWAYSVASDERVQEVREEAQDWLNNKVKSWKNISSITDKNFPRTWRAIVRLWAAGLMLIRDYGKDADTDQTSKDGYQKQKTAKGLLEEWLMDIQDDADTTSPSVVTVKTDGEVFARHREIDGVASEAGISPTTDEFFHHDE